MFRKSGHRFSEKDMLKRKCRARWRRCRHQEGVSFMFRTTKFLAAAGFALLASSQAFAFEVGIIGFQFSSETHARVANAAAAAAKAKGWSVTLLNSEGALPKHVEQ